MILDLETINLIMSNAGLIDGISRDALKKMLLGKMFNDDKFIVTDVENGNLRAFMFATIEHLDGQDVAFIQACYSNKEGSVSNMLERLEIWASRLGLHKVVFMTKRNPIGFERKYKFTKTYSVMEKLL